MPPQAAYQTLRWIGLLPLTVAAYLLINFLCIWIFKDGRPEIVYDVETLRILGEHATMGTFFIFQKETVPMAIALWVATSLAPSYKKTVFVALIMLWLLFLIYMLVITRNYLLAMQSTAVLVLELIAQGLGIGLVGFYLRKKKRG